MTWTAQTKTSSSFSKQSKNSAEFSNQENLATQTSAAYSAATVTYSQANLQYNGKLRPVWTKQAIS